jgi:predicted TIM-barrel fold metal-dependent hydrolase
MRPSRAIDFHCHAGRGTGLTGPWDTAAPLGAYLRRAARAGIERTVLIPAFHEEYRVANRELAAIVASRPERFLGFAMVHPARDKGRIHQMVREAVEAYGFRGIKVHRHDARITREVCETAADLSVPILYDVMGETSVIDLIAPEYPQVTFVIPHLGSFGDDWRAHRAVIDQMTRYPNVYVDTSGVRRFDYLVEAVARAGADHVLLGTDGPWLNPLLELIKVRLLGLPPKDEDRVLRGNAVRLLGLSGGSSPQAITRSPVRASRIPA